jgi:zinc finger SWIM domain-containing protein 3
MEFSTIEEAWMFWIRYGGQKGFEVRTKYRNKRKSDGKVRSCRYVCSNEAQRFLDKRDHLTKCPRAETRTDCHVRMGVVMDVTTSLSCHKPRTYGVSKENFRVARF